MVGQNDRGASHIQKNVIFDERNDPVAALQWRVRVEKAYKKECYSTLIAFGVVTLLTHVFPMYFLFPGLTQMTIFGFPAHYFLTLVLGWIVLMPLYWIYIQISEKIDREISELSGRAAELEEVRVYTATQSRGEAK